MTSPRTAFQGADIFDGQTRHKDHALVIEAGRVAAMVAVGQLDPAIPVHRLSGGMICPGFVDVQVNGGGGVMLNDAPTLQTLTRIAEAHVRLGATAILPTLITDSPAKTAAAIEAVARAIAAGVPGVRGLHLEGPHIAMARKGAHDPAFVRPMTPEDVTTLCDAARRLPVLMVTLAPEVVGPEQIGALTAAGAVVSLGHSDASFDKARAAVGAGARCVTHLFNAMSQLGSRSPGLVGAALAEGGLSAGLIADGHHVHPETLRLALRGKEPPGQIFLVSDAMAVAGTDAERFDLGGRTVLRRDGRLTLEDGTLAGADLSLLSAIRNLLRWQAAGEETALAMATAIPAKVAGLSDGSGTLRPGAPADFLHVTLAGDAPAKVWRGGVPIGPSRPLQTT
ncbi:N-acetylglucosamine-6-phosphate deacetylase [Nioella nitratireducens]|uniref:N-acetylglucosamine-6-phosphate deacetylase n=1 Tax=Nioella nitratireducens TaxID=1287720 RepID=UPI0008FD1EFC|nr:N-acetylglucosamine-6-phosphate deacetylase [Nioella nitratireducens]